MKKPQGAKEYRKFSVETATQKVLELFYKYPEKEFSLSDIARQAGVAKANVGNMIDELVSIGFLRVEKLAKIWRVRANQENQYFLRSKIVYNLNFIYRSGLIEFLYNLYNHPKSIILFGAFRKGEDISSSDIDIAVESDDFKEYKTIGLRELSDFEKAIGKKIQIHEFNRKLLDNYLFNNIANGIVLIGFLEVNR